MEYGPPDLLSEELAECEKRGKLPKAVIPTDLYGQCCDLPRIVEICDGYGVPVVCDSAEALGAKYLTQRRKDANGEQEKDNALLGDLGDFARGKSFHAGKGAKAAVFSFNGNKIITTSGGGMLASDDKEFIERARFLSQQARDPFPHYEHTEIGYNYRMSNVLAAIGRGQLRVLDERVKKKREIFDYYRAALGDVPGIEFIPEPEWSRSNRWLTVILITPEKFGTDRETVRLALEAENIEARPVWKPMHLQPVFRVVAQSRKLKAQSKAQNTYEVKVVGGTSRGQRSEVRGRKKTEVGDQKSEVRRKTHTRQEQLGGTSRSQEGKQRFQARMVGGKVSEDLFERGLCLPSGTAMTEEDLDRVVEVIRNCRKK